MRVAVTLIDAFSLGVPSDVLVECDGDLDKVLDSVIDFDFDFVGL